MPTGDAHVEATTAPSVSAIVAPQESRSEAFLFRALDVTVAALALALSAPLLLLVFLAIRFDSQGPVLFRQRRFGRGLKAFTVLKFRTMYHRAPAGPHRDYVRGLLNGDGGAAARGETNTDLYKLSGDRRITRVGGLLRRFSVDELPQFWNVLRGDMSVVGPRPAIPYEVDFYRPHWFGRFAVKPGLTGLWQVSGRNELDFRQMLMLDVEYVRRRSLKLNILIIAKTVGVVVRGRGCT